MDNREAGNYDSDLNNHPPACTCTNCVRRRLEKAGYTSKPTEDRSAFRPSQKKEKRHPSRFSWAKLLINILIISSLVALAVMGYHAFTHKVPPMVGTIGFLIFVVLFICLVSFTNSRSYKYRTPSFTSVFWSLVGIALVATFAGFEPLATYKDTAFTNIAKWWESSLNATNNMTRTTIPTRTITATPPTSAITSPSQTTSSLIDKANDAVKNFALWNTDTSDYVVRFNQYRQSKGCAPLVFTDDLNRIATLRLAEIKVNFSHNSKGQYNRYLAENIVEGVSNNQDALACWQGSPRHNANMLDKDYKYTGYAAGAGYAVQVFTEWNTINGIPQLPPGWHFTK